MEISSVSCILGEDETYWWVYDRWPNFWYIWGVVVTIPHIKKPLRENTYQK